MILLPAIDLMGGEVVRLKRGLATEKTVYSSDPVAFAKKWEDSGADWLHLVDLDAAFSGEPENLAVIEKICASVNIPCELGGGMRNFKNVSAAFSCGVSRVILGTKACESPEYIAEICAEFGGERIAVGIDANQGKVAVKGWTETTSTSVADLALIAQVAGAGTIIYTDIATDGMLEGPNFSELENLLRLLDCHLIASGGVSSAEDLRKLSKMPRLYGAIIGKALYDGHIVGNLRKLIS
ncbi:MAG: 1-(5-phosphoribosyl)-5-[(5-phosphoribosylamino)methylideneamino]imidazole-4-carboxamide isomerase [Terrimicrobiaceae bacterium]|nr:1-(5-phosphoribosyl)-5-[(5-phosphoribosylamino)methylideneamino]imidazole-4-carboxamide isomerase [Terrimicrobiaceae bacterium]